MMMKTCFKCSRELRCTEFYAHKATRDGLLGKCKECTRVDVFANRQKRLDHYRAACRENSRRPEVAALANAKSRAYRAANAQRRKAHSAVTDAVRAGRLIPQACSRCGASRAVAHHESYARPLDVVWYCAPHHAERHAQMKREGINA